jgi:ankyrin repeat protein
MVVSQEGRTALMWAAMKGNTEAVEALMQHVSIANDIVMVILTLTNLALWFLVRKNNAECFRT